MVLAIPCKDCICIAICRNKIFGQLIRDCEPIRVYFVGVESKIKSIDCGNHYYTHIKELGQTYCLMKRNSGLVHWSIVSKNVLKGVAQRHSDGRIIAFDAQGGYFQIGDEK